MFLFDEPPSARAVGHEVTIAPAALAPTPPQDVETLAGIGRVSATLAHDLRHLLTLAGMQLERARSLRSQRATTLELDDLGTTLEEAKAYCDACLPGPGRERRRTACSLRDLLHVTAHEAARIAGPTRSVRVQVRCPVSLRVGARADPLARLVRNLVLNAIEASMDGLQVRIEATQPDPSHIDLSIDDCGRGMEPAEVDLFYSRVCSGGSGTGIGTLSILDAARHIGATIHVESEPSRGTCVHVMLPTGPFAETTLVVDGHEARRRRLVAAYEANGGATKQAANARSALEILEGHPVDQLIVARGTIGPGWPALHDRALELGVPSTVQSVLDE